MTKLKMAMAGGRIGAFDIDAARGMKFVEAVVALSKSNNTWRKI